MKKRIAIMTIALLIVFGGIVGFNLFKKVMINRFFSNFTPPPISVSSVTALKKDWVPQLTAVGNFVAINGVDVNSEASGNVVKIYFDSGQYVQENAPLIDIDDSIEQSILKFNQADQKLRQLNYQRQTDLLKRNATATSSVDEANANLQQAAAQVEKIQNQIKQKHITAPFSGRLGINQINLGQYITPGQTSIVTLQVLDPLYLEFNLPEHLFKKIRINQSIRFKVESFPAIFFEGKITAINSKIDPNTHTILVQATLANCPLNALTNLAHSNKLITLRQDKEMNQTVVSCSTDKNTKNHVEQFAFIPGMFAEISIEQPPIPNQVILPSTAISYGLYGDSVFIIEKQPKKDAQGHEIFQVKRVFVKTGPQEGNYTLIESGVKPGQQVVSSGKLKLNNDARVVINNSVLLNEVANPSSLGE